MTLHATLVQLDGLGVLLCGPSGCGKSDLAIQLIAHFGALLVADDRVTLEAVDHRLWGCAPKILAGLIEIRGIGIVSLPHLARCCVDLRIDVVANRPQRMPDPEPWPYMGVSVPRITLYPFEASAVAKITLLVRGLAQNRLPVHWDGVV